MLLPHTSVDTHRPADEAAVRAGETRAQQAWLSRCATRVCQRDPAIAPQDAEELAWFMFTQDRYKSMPPEGAVDALFLAQQQRP